MLKLIYEIILDSIYNNHNVAYVIKRHVAMHKETQRTGVCGIRSLYPIEEKFKNLKNKLFQKYQKIHKMYVEYNRCKYWGKDWRNNPKYDNVTEFR